MLLDRDGTIIVDHGYVGSIERVELIPGAAAAISAFNGAGVPVAVVSNQSGVARGFYGVDDVERVHEHLSGLLAAEGAHVDLFLFCPYHPDGVVAAFTRKSPDRKPGPGMALAAAESLGLDLSRSWVVGDRPEDVEMARSVGAKAAYIGRYAAPAGAWPFPSLAEAGPFILTRVTEATAAGATGTGEICADEICADEGWGDEGWGDERCGEERTA